MGQIATELIPIVGQAADVRDFLHALEDIFDDEGYKKAGSWANLILAFIVFVPGLGDIVAKLGKNSFSFIKVIT